MSNELIEIEATTALKVFSSDNGLDPIIKQAKDVVSSFEHDLSTIASRKRTASLANKVAKLKTRLDGMGKDLVSDWKTKAKAVDSNRKAMREELDELKLVARKPLSDWEVEQKAIEEKQAFLDLWDEAIFVNIAKDEKRDLDHQMDHMQAIIDNSEFDKFKAEQAEQKRLSDELAEKQRLDREEAMKREAAEAARLEAERIAKENADRIEQEKQEALQREQQAILDKQEAERQAIAATERAKIEANHAEQRRIQAEYDAELLAEANLKRIIQQQQQAEENARLAAEQAKQKEILRQQAEKDKYDEMVATRTKNSKHRAAVKTRVKEGLMVYTNITEEQAIAIVIALTKNQIDGATINF